MLVRRIFAAVSTSALMILTAAPAGGAKPLDIGKLLDELDKLHWGDSSVGDMEMIVKTSRRETRIRMQVWSKGLDYALLRISEPSKVRGMATLKRGNDLWNYLPRTNRRMRVPSSLMSAAWMGSHFTNDDLVNESHYRDDFDCVAGEKKIIDGDETLRIRCTPKPDSAVEYGRIDIVVRLRDRMPLRQEFFDHKDTRTRTMLYQDFKKMGGRLLPATLVVIPDDKPNEKTTVIYHDLKFNVSLPESTFSLSQLGKR